MIAITGEFTSPQENRSFTVPFDTHADSTNIHQLTDAIKTMQAELNQYLTKRMEASNESADLSKDKEDEEEDDYDENENNEDTLQRRADIVPEATLKKQRTA